MISVPRHRCVPKTFEPQALHETIALAYLLRHGKRKSPAWPPLNESAKQGVILRREDYYSDQKDATKKSAKIAHFY